MQTEASWVQESLKDWGRRHRGKPGDEIGYARKANFARFMMEQGFERSEPAPPTDDSCAVDEALGYLGTRGRQGRIEANVLRAVYLFRLPRKKIAQRLHLSETEVRNARMMGERAVEMYLVMRLNWEGPKSEAERLSH